MSAKHKLNANYLIGAIVMGAVFGALTGSTLVFVIVSGLIIAAGVHDESIRA